MRAQITYHGGKTYWFRNSRFRQDVTQVVTDPETIKHCQATSGFSVAVDAPPKKKAAPAPAPKKVREVVREEEEAKPRGPVKKRSRSDD